MAKSRNFNHCKSPKNSQMWHRKKDFSFSEDMGKMTMNQGNNMGKLKTRT